MNNINEKLLIKTHEQALESARAESSALYIHSYNETDVLPCGFAWVKVYVKGSTRIGKLFKTLGYTIDYGSKGLSLWNPSGLHVQSLEILEHGARIYRDTMKKAFPELEIYYNSRLD